MNKFFKDPRFAGIEPFEKKVWLSSPTMHGEEQHWVDEAIRTNWVSTVGANINEVEKQVEAFVGVKYAVGLSCGTAALHLATKLAGEKLYGQARPNAGTLQGRRVFCSDMTFDASINPVAYEDGEAVFIDTGKMDRIRKIADEHGALIVEDAAESLGAKYRLNGHWVETGTLGDYNCISFNGNKIITGSAGGMFLTDSEEDANKVRKWSTQSREAAPWYQHEEIGYNYRMSNIIAGIIRGQLPYLDEHIAQKRAIYERYKAGFADLPVRMNPFDEEHSQPNHWLSCLIIDQDAMAPQVRGEQDYLYASVSGKSSPQEILEAMAAFNAEGRPIWKPMHMQPIYRNNVFVTEQGVARGCSNAYIDQGKTIDIGADIFERGLCLPSDNKMTMEQVDRVVKIISCCFK